MSCRCALWGWRKGVPGGDTSRRCEGRPGSSALPPPAARPLGWAVEVRCPSAVGAGVRAWVGVPPVLGAGGGAWVRVVCVVPVPCLCAAGCVAVQCVPWCRGAWCCLPWSVSLVPPLLHFFMLLCLPWLVAVPPPPRASLARLLATLLLPSLLPCSLPFPLLSVGLPYSLACISPYLRPCVCLGLSPCLLPWSPGPPLSLLLGPVRQRKDGGVGYCGGGSTDDDGVCVVAPGSSVCGHTFHSLCGCVGVGRALGYTSLVTFVRWRGFRCAFPASVPRCDM